MLASCDAKTNGSSHYKMKASIIIAVAITTTIVTRCISVGHQGSSNSTPVTSGNCQEAAREAGLPDDVLDKIENP